MQKPANAPWVSSYLIVKDVDKAVDFYQNAFGFKLRDKSPGDDNTSWHAELMYHDQLIMIGKEGAWGGKTKAPVSNNNECPISLYVYVDDVDKFYKHATANKSKGITEPKDEFWGDRMCKVSDPDGYVWCFATPGKV